MPGMFRAAGAAALTLSLLAPTAAYADHWASTDAERDVEGWRYDPEPKPCGEFIEVDGTAETHEDITRLSVRHTRRAMIVTTRFRDLDRTLEHTLSLYVRSAERGWWLDVDRYQNRNGHWRVLTFMAREPKLPDPDDIEGCGIGISLTDIGCRISHEVDFDADRISLVVPRGCMGNPRWVRVGADAYRFVEPEDPAHPWTTFSDEWDGGVELSPWMPPFGPRVPATKGAQIGGTLAKQATGERRKIVVRRDGIITRR